MSLYWRFIPYSFYWIFNLQLHKLDDRRRRRQQSPAPDGPCLSWLHQWLRFHTIMEMQKPKSCRHYIFLFLLFNQNLHKRVRPKQKCTSRVGYELSLLCSSTVCKDVKLNYGTKISIIWGSICCSNGFCKWKHIRRQLGSCKLNLKWLA